MQGPSNKNKQPCSWYSNGNLSGEWHHTRRSSTLAPDSQRVGIGILISLLMWKMWAIKQTNQPAKKGVFDSCKSILGVNSVHIWSHLNFSKLRTVLPWCDHASRLVEVYLTPSHDSAQHRCLQMMYGQAAIRHIRNLAQENHDRALPKLQERSLTAMGNVEVTMLHMYSQ